MNRLSRVTGWKAMAVTGLALLALLPFASVASPLQLVSASGLADGPPAGGGGDSYLPILSADGRYVLFASTADNLAEIATNRPIPTLFPAPLNVFMRDRTNGSTALVSVSFDAMGGGN